MIRLLLIVCLGIFLLISDGHGGQIIEIDKAPKIIVTPESWDFGITTEFKIQTHNFEVKNTGNALLTIKSVTTSCGCTNATLSLLKIEPGETANLKVDIDPKQMKSSGKIKRQVYIESNDPEEPIKIVSIFLEINPSIDSKKSRQKFSQFKPILKTKHPPKISSQKLNSLIETGKKIVILDVREENEYIRKHIPEAIWFPKSKFDKQDQELLKKLEVIDKKVMVVAYCVAGHRSNYVAKKLREVGYNAYILDGVSFWEKENLPLVRGPKLPPSEEPAIIRLEEAYENYYLLFKDVVWIDVRDTQDYKRGHIKRALGIPLSEIKAGLSEISKDKEIVFYCEGTWDGGSCEASRSAGRILIKNGYKQGKIKVFEDGYGAWENAGYPVE